jgi:hypothetical protein
MRLVGMTLKVLSKEKERKEFMKKKEKEEGMKNSFFSSRSLSFEIELNYIHIQKEKSREKDMKP